MIKAVIFDVDDTLISTGEKTVSKFIEVAKKIGLRVPAEKEVARLLGLPWITMVDTLWPGIDIDYYIESYEKHKGKKLPTSCVSGAKEVVYKTKQDFFIGIITSRNHPTLVEVMDECGIDLALFDYLECNDQNEFAKPDPRVFNNLKKSLGSKGIEQDEILYVGDAIYDYLSASGAGLHFIAFLNGAYTREEFVEEGLDEKYTIENLNDLSVTIKGIEEKVRV